MQKIVIRTPNFIGDTINTTPAIELLKEEYPDAEFTLIGPAFIRDIFKYDRRVTRMICFEKGKRKDRTLLKELRKEPYDLGILFINTFISALLFKMARIRKIIGYNNEGRGFLLDFKLKINRNIHYINHYATLVNKFLNNKYTFLPPLTVTYTKEETFGFENQQPTIGLYLGGKNKGYRRYPEQLSVELLKQLSGYNIVLIGDKNDNANHETYLEEARLPNAINLTGKTTVEGLINTISNLDLLVTIDSAAMHIAAATETPFIALMGLSTSPTSVILPKVDFGKILKVENNMINEENYMNNLCPEIITDKINSLLPPVIKKSKGI